MNTTSIIITILIPLVVVIYIILDLFFGKKNKSPKMSHDKNVDDILFDSGENHGERLSQSTLLDNTNHMLDSYYNIFQL